MSLNTSEILIALNIMSSLAKSIVEIAQVLNGDMSDEQKRAFIQGQNEKQTELMLKLEESLT